MRDYWFYGLRLRTPIPFEGLPAWPAGVEGETWVLREAPVVERLDEYDRGGALATRPPGDALVRLRRLFRMFVPAAGDATIEFLGAARPVDVEPYLLSFVAGVILHRRRRLPLHASCGWIDGTAIAFVGRSGQGKSTLAAALARDGQQLLSDDITVVTFDEAGAALATPGSPNLRLHEDSMGASGLDAEDFREVTTPGDKRIRVGRQAQFSPVPLAAVIRLEWEDVGGAPNIERLRGLAAFTPLDDVVYRLRMARRLGAAPALSAALLRLAGSTPIYRLRRPRDFAALDATISLLRRDLAGQ